MGGGGGGRAERLGGGGQIVIRDLVRRIRVIPGPAPRARAVPRCTSHERARARPAYLDEAYGKFNFKCSFRLIVGLRKKILHYWLKDKKKKR